MVNQSMDGELYRVFSMLKHSVNEDLSDTDDKSLDWMWSIREATPLLKLICERVNEHCIVSDEEWAQFQELERRGQVLPPEQLRTIVADTAHHTDSSKKIPRSPPVVSVASRQRLINAQTRRKSLLSELSEKRLLHSTKITEVRQAEIELQQQKTMVLNLGDIFHTSLERIAKHIHPFADLNNQMWKNACLISNADVRQYEKLDNAFTKSVQTLFEELVVKRKDNAEIAEPITEDRTEEYERNVCELERIQRVYVESESRRTEALARLEKTRAMLKEIDMLNINSSITPCSSDELTKSLEAEATKKTAVNDTRENILSPLFKQTARLQSSIVLEGDYSLKIARQQAAIDRHMTVLRCLQQQRARHWILQEAMQVERKAHEHIVNVVDTIHNHLQSFSEAAIRRQHTYDLLHDVCEGNDTERRTVDSRDEFTMIINELIANQTTQTTQSLRFVTYEGMYERSLKLQRSLTQTREKAAHSQSDFIKHLKAMMKMSSTMSLMLTKSSSTSSATLSDIKLNTILHSTKEKLQRLKELVYTIQRDEADKRNIIAQSEPGNPVVFCRTLFIKFFNNCTQLDDQVRAISQRIDSLKKIQ